MGCRIALTAWDEGNQDIWIHDLERGANTRWTFNPAEDRNPVWSPDGDSLAFWSLRRLDTNGAGTFIRLLDSRDPPQRLSELTLPNWPTSWSRDGRYIVLTVPNPEIGQDLWYVDMTEDERKAVALLETPFEEGRGVLSPDGRNIAYDSNESGRIEVYVHVFPAGGGKWQVSIDGGAAPRFSPLGDEIFFLQPGAEEGVAAMMAAPVLAGEPFRTGPPRKLFHMPETQSPNYDVSADAQRFLVWQREQGSDAPPTTIIFVENWFQECAGRE